MGNVMVLALFLETAIYAKLEEGTKMDGWYQPVIWSGFSFPHFLIRRLTHFPFGVWKQGTPNSNGPYLGTTNQPLERSPFRWAEFKKFDYQRRKWLGGFQKDWVPVPSSARWWQAVTGEHSGNRPRNGLCEISESLWVEVWAKIAKMINVAMECHGSKLMSVIDCVSCQAHTHTYI